MPSAFEKMYDWSASRGLDWLIEFLSLLFGTGLFALIAVLAVFLISRIPNREMMGLVALFIHPAITYLFLDAASWRDQTPGGNAYPVMATLLLVSLALVTWWTWEKNRS